MTPKELVTVPLAETQKPNGDHVMTLMRGILVAVWCYSSGGSGT